METTKIYISVKFAVSHPVYDPRYEALINMKFGPIRAESNYAGWAVS